jgi:hypothetical protein
MQNKKTTDIGKKTIHESKQQLTDTGEKMQYLIIQK